MGDFPVVDLTSTNVLGGITHDEFIRCVAALAAGAATGSNGKTGAGVTEKARVIERYLRNG
jgi:hypothetical protein